MTYSVMAINIYHIYLLMLCFDYFDSIEKANSIDEPIVYVHNDNIS